MTDVPQNPTGGSTGGIKVGGVTKKKKQGSGGGCCSKWENQKMHIMKLMCNTYQISIGSVELYFSLNIFIQLINNNLRNLIINGWSKLISYHRCHPPWNPQVACRQI